MNNHHHQEIDTTEPKRLPLNVSGRYYITEDCDGCAYCASLAPENFDFDRDNNQYHVSRQPANDEEEDFVQEAMDDCPIDAIRIDGKNSKGQQ